MKQKTVFVTGGTGLVGSHLLYFLLKSGHSVIALYRNEDRIKNTKFVFKQYPEGVTLCEQINWVKGDVLKPETYAEHLKRCVFVYHCAAVVSFVEEDKNRLRHTNLSGTENIASLCLDNGIRLCYVSSIAALGDAVKEEDMIDENTPEIANREHSEYSHSKGEAEKIVWHYIHRGLNAVIVNPSIILGVSTWKNSSTRLFFTVAKGVPFYTKGVVGYVDVRDVCELMIRLTNDLSVKGERFILNGGNYSYKELFALIARTNGKTPPRWYLAPWMTNVAWRLLAIGGKLSGEKPVFTKEMSRSAHRRSYYSNTKILGHYPDFQFYSLRETVQHIRLAYINISNN